MLIDWWSYVYTLQSYGQSLSLRPSYWSLGSSVVSLLVWCPDAQGEWGNSYSWWFQKSQETRWKASHENSPQIIDFLPSSVEVGEGCVFLWSRRAVTNWLCKNVSTFPFDLADVCRKHGFFRFIQEVTLPSKKGNITISHHKSIPTLYILSWTVCPRGVFFLKIHWVRWFRKIHGFSPPRSGRTLPLALDLWIKR